MRAAFCATLAIGGVFGSEAIYDGPWPSNWLLDHFDECMNESNVDLLFLVDTSTGWNETRHSYAQSASVGIERLLRYLRRAAVCQDPHGRNTLEGKMSSDRQTVSDPLPQSIYETKIDIAAAPGVKDPIALRGGCARSDCNGSFHGGRHGVTLRVGVCGFSSLLPGKICVTQSLALGSALNGNQVMIALQNVPESKTVSSAHLEAISLALEEPSFGWHPGARKIIIVVTSKGPHHVDTPLSAEFICSSRKVRRGAPSTWEARDPNVNFRAPLGRLPESLEMGSMSEISAGPDADLHAHNIFSSTTHLQSDTYDTPAMYNFGVAGNVDIGPTTPRDTQEKGVLYPNTCAESTRGTATMSAPPSFTINCYQRSMTSLAEVSDTLVAHQASLFVSFYRERVSEQKTTGLGWAEWLQAVRFSGAFRNAPVVTASSNLPFTLYPELFVSALGWLLPTTCGCRPPSKTVGGQRQKTDLDAGLVQF